MTAEKFVDAFYENHCLALHPEEQDNRFADTSKTMRFHFSDGGESIELGTNTTDIIKGLQFKAKHINTNIEPYFYELAAHRLNIIASKIEDMQHLVD